MLLAGTVILFNPDESNIRNLKSYSAELQMLYVFDNTENQSENTKKLLSEISNCVYFNDGQNDGVAKRLNQACKQAINDGFKWLLTMDQDSYFEKADIKDYLNCLTNLAGKEQIALTGVETVSVSKKGNACTYAETASLITSGSIVNLAAYSKVGEFDEALFIDQVDMEYCYRSIKEGFTIIKFINIFLHHSLGRLSVHRSLKNFKSTNRSLHSPLRLYYMTRNYLYVRVKYKKDFPTEIAKTRKDTLIRIKNNFLYGNTRMLLLKMILKGVIDFNKNKMGKLNTRN